MSERDPITTELRAALDVDREFMRADGTVVAQTFCVDRGDFDRLCDAIDAVHAALRERVAELDKRGDSMHDGGSITDELREWASVEVPYKYGHQLTAIADRIDAEHESACAEAYGNGVMSVPIALDESQWVKLPVDADGEPIHIGDVMENIVCPSVHREVTGVGVECFYGWDDGNGRYSQFSANCYRHHHAPTVEDVLREFGRGWHEQMNAPETFDIADYVERYAAKLRLAGDAK